MAPIGIPMSLGNLYLGDNRYLYCWCVQRKNKGIYTNQHTIEHFKVQLQNKYVKVISKIFQRVPIFKWFVVINEFNLMSGCVS